MYDNALVRQPDSLSTALGMTTGNNARNRECPRYATTLYSNAAVAGATAYNV